MQYSIADIARVIGAERTGTSESGINWLLIDSRSLCFPEETLFFALRTQKNDGHRYIHELYKRGVRNFVVEQLPDTTSGEAHPYPDANFLKVHSTLEALQVLAAYHRSQLDIPVIGVTGSNGKTTVKEWLYQLLSPDYNVCRSPRSYNSQVGVPLSVWLINRHTDIAIIETGISQPGEMQRIERIVRPTVGVMTNLGAAHQEHFLSPDIKCTEKMALFANCRDVVLNYSAPTIRLCSAIIPKEVKRVTWRKAEAPADIVVREIEKATDTATVRYLLDGTPGSYTIPFIDDAAIENSITCFAACLALSRSMRIDMNVIARRMSTLEQVAMRMEVKDGANGCTLINDTYNSDVQSLDIALDFMARRPDPSRRRRTLILSDILQSGESPRSLYSRVAQMVERRLITKVLGVGEEISSCAEYFPMEHHFFRTTAELLASDAFASLHDEFILIKGARRFRFDKVSDRLTLKVHQTILEVDLNALAANVAHYRSFMRPETRMVCMVKASGYGIGAFETSKTLQDAGVDYLAVAVADEGADMRRNGITANIMVMNPELTSFKMLFDYRLEPEVFSFEILEALIRAAEREGLAGFPVHIKLDTGMHRLGFDPERDMPRLIDRLTRQTAIVPCSVFTHFVGSDEDCFDEFSHRQFALFDRASKQLQAAYNHHILRHICNSAAIEHFPQYHLDMVRLGLGLYGIDPRTHATLNHVATLTTTILQLRHVPAGDSIGYSRRTVMERDSVIAAIPIGYADGIDRHLGNRHCYCLVGGKRAEYVGNICMDVCMIDVTGIDCRVGDSVTIFGPDLPVAVLSDVIGTIPYEVLTGISSRVQKVYVKS